MENDDIENEEKKQSKHISAIRLSLTWHKPLIPTKTKKANKFRTG